MAEDPSDAPYSYFFLINLFIFFLAELRLRCCAQAFSSCGERGLLFVAGATLLPGHTAKSTAQNSCS